MRVGIIKAFNTVFAQILSDLPASETEREVQVFEPMEMLKIYFRMAS